MSNMIKVDFWSDTYQLIYRWIINNYHKDKTNYSDIWKQNNISFEYHKDIPHPKFCIIPEELLSMIILETTLDR